MSHPQTSQRPLKSADLDDLKQQQIDATATTDGRGDIAHLDGNTPEGGEYTFPAHEAHLVHVELVTSTPNAQTREFNHTRKIVKLSPQEFERMEKNESFAEYDEVNVLHDPRPKARQQADATGDVRTGSPAEPSKPLATLNDAQMRYFELTGEHAPTDKTRGQLIDLIDELESKLGAEKTTSEADPAKQAPAAKAPSATKKPLRTLADYQARYKEVAGKDAPADKIIAELKEAITHFEAEKPQA